MLEVRRFAAGLRAVGLMPGERLVLCLFDDRIFPIAFSGAIWAGVVPVPVNTMSSEAELRFQVEDSGAVAALISAELMPVWIGIAADLPVFAEGQTPFRPLAALFAFTDEHLRAYQAHADDIAFWLYSSGSTGNPKGVLHRHSSLVRTFDLYGRPVAGYHQCDVVLSVAKLFFAYGLGNALTFPMCSGAASVRSYGRARPETISELIDTHGVTILCGVPSFFAHWLAAPASIARMPHLSLRLGISAGEALPASLLASLVEKLEVDVLDGLGSTELLHIFVSQRAGHVRAGVTGQAVGGYELRVVDGDGQVLSHEHAGQLQVRGPTAASGYWLRSEKTAATFAADGWVSTGDQVRLDADG